MRELSLNVLDIAQNSIAAKASCITLSVTESVSLNRLTLGIEDNGCGMSAEQLQRVRDPFFTTRTTRRVGMGIPLFRMAAEMAGGSLTIDSVLGKGTVVTAVFLLDHIDRPPLGDMVGTVSALIRLNPQLDFVYRHQTDDDVFEADTRSFREILGDVPLNEPEIIQWIAEYLTENVQALNSQA